MVRACARGMEDNLKDNKRHCVYGVVQAKERRTNEIGHERKWAPVEFRRSNRRERGRHSYAEEKKKQGAFPPSYLVGGGGGGGAVKRSPFPEKRNDLG